MLNTNGSFMERLRMTRRNSIILGICLAAVFMSSPATAEEPAARIVTVSIPPEGWPPYVITNNGGHAGGILLDVLREIARTTGFSLEVVRYPEVRGRLLTQHGEVDAYPKAREWVPEPDAFLWNDPIVESTDIVLSIAGAHVHFNGPQDLFGLDVGVIHGFGYPTLDAHFNNGDIRAHRVRTTQNLIDMVADRRIDCAVTNRIVATWIIKETPRFTRSRFEFSETTVDSASYRFAFTRQGDWGPLISRFNEELARMKADGRLDAILNRYR